MLINIGELFTIPIRVLFSCITWKFYRPTSTHLHQNPVKNPNTPNQFNNPSKPTPTLPHPHPHPNPKNTKRTLIKKPQNTSQAVTKTRFKNISNKYQNLQDIYQIQDLRNILEDSVFKITVGKIQQVLLMVLCIITIWKLLIFRHIAEPIILWGRKRITGLWLQGIVITMEVVILLTHTIITSKIVKMPQAIIRNPPSTCPRLLKNPKTMNRIK